MSIDARSRAVIMEAFTQRQPVLLSGSALDVTFQTYIVSVETSHLLLENRIKPKWISAFIASQGFSLQAGMVRFAATEVASDGERLVFPLKEDSVIEETRQAERFSFAADEKVVSEILNPFDGETRLTKSVIDMSATGLSLRTAYQSDLFEPGTVLPEVRVLIGGELYKQAQGRVVYRRKLMDLQGQMRMQVGIKFES